MVKRKLLLVVLATALVCSSFTAFAEGEETGVNVIGSSNSVNSAIDEANDQTSAEDQNNGQAIEEPPIEPPVVEEPAVNKNEDGLEIVTTYELVFPENMIIDLGYKEHPVFMKYFLVRNGAVNIRQLPNVDSPVVTTSKRDMKLRIMETVKGQQMTDSDLWHKVEWYSGNDVRYGYIYSGLGVVREFQFQKMVSMLDRLKNEVNANKTAYISNYKNYNGKPPKHNGNEHDGIGGRRSQSAPAYEEPNSKSNFRYLSDGHLVSIVGNSGNYYKVKSIYFEREYWVPKKYVTLRNSIKELKHAVIVDRKNQNEAVFDYLGDNKWQLLSFVYATTGANTKHKEPTDLGFYMAIQTKERFLYLDDETKEIDGYAPYATRFNGGAYIHGVPVAFIKEPIGEPAEVTETDSEEDAEKAESNETADVEEKEIEYRLVDPGMRESIRSLGTVPLSHKCVRNFTSHAKFIYDWVKIGSSSIIVIE